MSRSRIPRHADIETSRENLHSRRRKRFPWSVIVVLICSLLLGATLNGRALSRTAHALEPGLQRDVLVAASDVIVRIAEQLHLDAPRDAIDVALGKDQGTTVSTAGPSPATTATAAVTTSSFPAPTTTLPRTMTTLPSSTTTVILTTTTLPGLFVPRTDRPANLWVTGDSLTERFGPSLVNLLASTGVIEARRDVVYSSGLTRPDFFDWPEYLDRQLAGSTTDILVFMVGANDGQPIETTDGWIPFGAEGWVAEYRSRVAATMQSVSALVPTVYWVGQPIARSPDYTNKMAVMDEVYRAEASRYPNVRYLDTWPLFVDDRGDYSAYLPDATGREALMRSSDGIHLTPDGGERLADFVSEAISRDWVLPGLSQDR